MVLEQIGNQMRLRVKNPDLFIEDSFRTQNVGIKGRLQRVAGRLKSSGEWETQSWRFNIKDYKSKSSLMKHIREVAMREGIEL